MKATFTLDARALAALSAAKRRRVLDTLAQLAARPEGEAAEACSDDEVRRIVDLLRAAPGVSVEDEAPAAPARDRDETTRRGLESAAARLERAARRLDRVAEERRVSRELSQRLAENQAHARALEHKVEAAQAELDAMRRTLSWRITAPLRFTRTLQLALARLWWRVRPHLKTAAHYVAERIPLSAAQRDALWKTLRRGAPAPEAATEAPPAVLVLEDVEYADSPASAAPVSNVRVVAFYDPSVRAHWLDVASAAPQFRDHAQPRLPKAGFYDPAAAGVLSEQAALARHHGVDAFCFRLVWGDREASAATLEAWRSAPEAKLGFCLCFDPGERPESLQSEEPIAYAATLFSDPRYLRIGGRPLLVIARPQDWTDVAKTLQSWRAYCAARDLPTPYLAYTQDASTDDPALFGCDAAIELPPHLCGARDLTPYVEVTDDDYVGRVLDYADLRQRRPLWVAPAFPVYRGVCPAWDDEAARPHEGEALHGARPALFRDWIAYAARDTEARHASGQRLLFLNSWNEWRNGSAVEPDLAHGHAWLRALRDGLEDAARPAPADGRFVVVVHVFYRDIFEQILAQLARFRAPFELIVTCPEDRAPDVREALAQWNMGETAKVVACENRGRDVLPFLQAMRAYPPEPNDIVLKLHTKRSKHRADGGEWRDRMYASLLAGDAPQRVLDAFRYDQKLGMAAPEGVLAPITLNLGPNEDAIAVLLARAGFAPIDTRRDVFAAGSMFYIRARHLAPILEREYEAKDFEAEAGQLDGTFAHAIERMFTLAVLRQGAVVVDAAPPRAREDVDAEAEQWRLR